MGEVSATLGDPVGFYRRICERLASLGIDAGGLALSHLANRTKTYREYLNVRDALEKAAIANVENVWNGRPISKILLASPVALSADAGVDLIELIPPYHQSVYPMGLEHVGFVVGDGIEEFGKTHREALTGQQFQSPVCEPYVVRFDDFTHAKFYRYSLMDVCVLEGQRFDRISHARWSPVDLDTGPYPSLSS